MAHSASSAYVQYPKYVIVQGVLGEQLFVLSICILSCCQVIAPCSWNKGNTLKVHFLQSSCSQYLLRFRQIARGKESK